MKWTLDTDAVNENAPEIVARLGQEPISVYIFLHDEYAKGDITQNHVFQFVFWSFYRMDNAGLTDKFKVRFFQLLEENRGSLRPDISQLTRTLWEFPTLQDANTLQFSFVTKLANTVNPNIPIYDSKVAKMYGFTKPDSNGRPDLVLQKLCEFHEFLGQDYERIIRQNLLQTAINELHRVAGTAVTYLTPIKKIDFLAWSAGKVSL